MTICTLSAARRSVGAVLLTLALCGVPVVAQDVATTETKIKAALDALRDTKARPKSDPFETNVREMMWRLVIGNLAGDPALKLPSETRSYLDDNLVQLNTLLTDNDMQQKLAANPKLLALLDRIVRLQPVLAKKKDLARNEERERLNQLRDLGATYRDLTASLAAMNTYFVLGDEATVRKLNEDVTSKIKKIEEIARRRVDYYLFKDEPKLDAEEVKLLTSVAEPLVNDMVTHFKSLQGLMAYRLAVDPRATRTLAERKKGLEDALAQVKALTSDPGKASLLAYYVEGIGNHELGRLTTQDRPLDKQAHTDAAPLYKAARDSYARAADRLLKETKTAERIGGDLRQRVSELTSSKVFLDEADKQASEGEFAAAAETLARALQVWREPRVIVALGEARLRAGQETTALRNFLADAVLTGALTNSDREGLVLRGRADISNAWEQLAQGPEKVPVATRKRLLQQLREGGQHLANATKGAADARLDQLVRAFLALDLAYATYLDPDSEPVAARKAFDGLKDLVGQLKEQLAKAPSDKAKLESREALVAARLAQGFLSIRFQPSYREDALLAFAAAADEQARLRGVVGSTKLFGSPVLAAMLSRPDMKGLKVAAEERQLRELIGQVAEGLATLRLGKPEAAAGQIKSALERVETLKDDPPVDAAKLLDAREIDARALLRTRTRALAVLTLVAGNQLDVALLEGVKLSKVPMSAKTVQELTPAEVRLAASGISDPLASYALGLAVEEYAASRLKPGSKEARDLLREATLIQQLTGKRLTDSPALRQRYPQVEVLTAQALKRLTEPESYLASARELRQQSQVLDAIRVIEEGLRRHPDEPGLQEERILVKLDEVEVSPQRGKELLTQTVAEASQASTEGVLRDARGLLALGAAQERLGQDEEAMATYRLVLRAKPAEAERLRASVRLSVLSARQAAKAIPTR